MRDFDSVVWGRKGAGGLVREAVDWVMECTTAPRGMTITHSERGDRSGELYEEEKA